MREEIINAIQRDLVYAIIPARSGSKGIPNKNIMLLGGFPVIAYSIVAAKLTKGIDRVIVSTDSRHYADIAIRYGAEVPVLRPAAISQDTSIDFEFIEHSINWLFDNEGKVPEYFVHLRPTTPLRETAVIEKAIARFKADDKATSLRSGHPVNFTPHKWFWKDKNDYFNTIIDGMNLDDANNPRQSFPNIYIPDGYVDVLRTEYIIKHDKIHGNLMIGFESPDSIDIDFKEEADRFEEIIGKSDSDVYQCLKNTYGERTTA
jgi:CMP-N-acetylneuraminic acid synthetase